MPLEQPKPTSFLRSTWEGIKGFFKGGIVGGGIGAIGGTVVGAAIALVGAFFMPGAITWGLGGVGGAAVFGAALGSLSLATIGMPAGVIAGVVKSREAAQPSAGALVNALNMAHQHGELVGQQQVVQQLMAQQQQQQAAHTVSWQDKEKERDKIRAQAATAVTQANNTVH